MKQLKLHCKFQMGQAGSIKEESGSNWGSGELQSACAPSKGSTALSQATFAKQEELTSNCLGKAENPCVGEEGVCKACFNLKRWQQISIILKHLYAE